MSTRTIDADATTSGTTQSGAQPPTGRTRAPRQLRHSGKLASNVVLILIAVLFLTPLSWLLLAALDPDASARTAIPDAPTLENYATILTWDLGFRPLLNALGLSMIAAVVTVVCAVLASYPLSRFQMRFNQPFLYTVLFATCLPISAMMVPVFSLAVRAGVLDSFVTVALFMAATSLPMAIWMTKNFMDSVPISLEEAAWVDGASGMKALRHIVVPLMRPGVAVVFIYVFMGAWGNFFVPFLLLRSSDKLPAAVTIYQFFGQYGTIDYGLLAAFSVLYALPAIILYVLVSRGIGGGFTMGGAMKG